MANYTEEQWNARKNELMEKCYNGFADLGLHGTGIRALANHCGYNASMIYTYFEDLDDLIIQSTEYCMSKVEDDFMAKAPEDIESLWRFIDEIPYWTAEKHGKKYRLMYQVYTHPKYREYGKRFFAGVDKRYTEYAKSLESKLGIPYEKLTPLIFILIRACVHYALFEDEFYLKSQTEVLKESSMAYACWIRCDHSGGSARPTCSQTAVCTVCGGEIPAAGHDFRMIERVEPTETEDGRLVYVCFQCGSYYAHVLPAGGSCVSEQFTDVDRSAWYHSAVDFVVGAGLMDGVRSDAFEPAGTVTRAMITVILYRLSGVTWTGKASDFTDVPENIWYAQAVAWAESCGVAEGVGGGRFAPDEPVTREQLAAMLYRYARLNGYDVSGAAVLDGFTDAGDVSAWAKAAVRWAVKNGLLEGSTGNRLLPGDGAQRAEAAALIQRFAETFILYD